MFYERMQEEYELKRRIQEEAKDNGSTLTPSEIEAIAAELVHEEPELTIRRYQSLRC
ncbi:hypothetical protein KY311_00025 [Candidatus Woesearchaeota archaeon]|nr:hypothetical protein [Candidatus Woesearchaeota archaeon]